MQIPVGRVHGYIISLIPGGLAAREARQTGLLAEHALLRMPRIYRVLEKEQTGLPMDALFMLSRETAIGFRRATACRRPGGQGHTG